MGFRAAQNRTILNHLMFWLLFGSISLQYMGSLIYCIHLGCLAALPCMQNNMLSPLQLHRKQKASASVAQNQSGMSHQGRTKHCFA
jgi:hypothetical protein